MATERVARSDYPEEELMEPSFATFRHAFTACPCGHGEHIGRGLEKITAIICPECGVLAGVNTLTIVSIETAEREQLNVGSRVRHDGRTLTVVQIEQVTKLWGKIGTDFVRVVMA